MAFPTHLPTVTHPAYVFGLPTQSNPHNIENPFNFAYNHILTAKSNHNSENYLWTAPQFDVVEIDGKLDGFKVTSKPQASAPAHGYRTRFALKNLLPNLDSSDPSDGPSGGSSDAQGGAVDEGDSEGSGDEAADDDAGGNTTVTIQTKQDNRKIADFVVGYLRTAKKTEIIFNLEVALLTHRFFPIIVEGKRAPSRSDLAAKTGDPLALRHAIDDKLKLAINDHVYKLSIYLNTIKNRSYIAMAYTGPWWAFTVCNKHSTKENLKWSKVFAFHTPKHEEAMNVLFKAAQDDYENPEANNELIEFLEANKETALKYITVVE